MSNGMDFYQRSINAGEVKASTFLISLGIGLLLQAAAIIWWASKLQAQVQHNDFQIQMMQNDVEKNTTFVSLWPAGKWGSGSLPSDVKQDLKIEMLESQVDKLITKIYNGSARDY